MRIASVIAAGLLSASLAEAAIIINNLPTTVNNAGSPVTGTSGKANAFTMPAGGSYYLDSITVAVGDFNSGDRFLVRLYDNQVSATAADNNTPGTSLATLTLSGSWPTTSGSYQFTFTAPASTVVLSASSSYWVAVTPSVGTVNWNSQTVTTSSELSPGATQFSQMFGTNDPSGWQRPGGNSSTLNNYRVDGTLVPEPAALSLLAGGLLPLLRRRRR
jgi:hypothetical protein